MVQQHLSLWNVSKQRKICPNNLMAKCQTVCKQQSWFGIVTSLIGLRSDRSGKWRTDQSIGLLRADRSRKIPPIQLQIKVFIPIDYGSDRELGMPRSLVFNLVCQITANKQANKSGAHPLLCCSHSLALLQPLAFACLWSANPSAQAS